MLAGTGLGYDLGLAHALGKQRLTKDIIDLVRAGVVQLVSLQIQFGPAIMGCQPLGEIERARPTDIMGLVVSQLACELGICCRGLVGAFHLKDQRHQGLGHKAAAMHAEAAALVRLVTKRIEVYVGHDDPGLA